MPSPVVATEQHPACEPAARSARMVDSSRAACVHCLVWHVPLLLLVFAEGCWCCSGQPGGPTQFRRHTCGHRSCPAWTPKHAPLAVATTPALTSSASAPLPPVSVQLPKLFELVGLGYSAWFTYRYLLFKSSREELVDDIEALKKKIRRAAGVHARSRPCACPVPACLRCCANVA